MINYGIVDLPRIAIIGKEGLCTKEKNIVQNLWQQAKYNPLEKPSVHGIKDIVSSLMASQNPTKEPSAFFIPRSAISLKLELACCHRF